jgi:hypothetical protein
MEASAQRKRIFYLTRYGFALSIIGLIWGCTQYVVLDKLNTVVLVSYYEKLEDPQSCFKSDIVISSVYPCVSRPAKARPGEKMLIFLKALNSRDISVPMPGKSMSLELVYTNGDAVAEVGYSFSNYKVNSGDHGDNIEPIILVVNNPGVYLAKVRYLDRNVESIAYGPPIIVLSQ